MRAFFPAAALGIAGFSLAVSLFPRSADSTLCRYGGCRYDQLFEQVDAAGDNLKSVEALLLEDPANPGAWCGYGELLASKGDSAAAAHAFDRALALGPRMVPVLMRIADFDFTHDRLDQALALVPHILEGSNAFDQLLFSYLDATGLPVEQVAGKAIPAEPRPAQAWLGWLEKKGSAEALRSVWSWMRTNRLADPQSAEHLTRILWDRRDYQASSEIWHAWSGAESSGQPTAELLSNGQFQAEPHGVPFDWDLTPKSSLDYERRNGLEVHFLGKENLDYSGIDQSTTIVPGRYVFAAETSAENLTTDQGPFFRIEDLDSPGRLTVETKPVLGTVARTQSSVDFTVPPGCHALRVRLIRRPSLKFDNKITGTLHIWQESLRPVPSA